MFEAGVEHFLDPVQLRTPQVAEIVETLVYRRKALVNRLFQGGKPLINRYKSLVNAAELGIDVGQKDPDEPGVEQHRNADGEAELLVCHLH